MNTVDRRACFPEVATDCVRVRVRPLVVTFRALAIAEVRITELNEAGNIDFRAGGRIRTQGGATADNLNAEVSNRGGIKDCRKRSRDRVVFSLGDHLKTGHS